MTTQTDDWIETIEEDGLYLEGTVVKHIAPTCPPSDDYTANDPCEGWTVMIISTPESEPLPATGGDLGPAIAALILGSVLLAAGITMILRRRKIWRSTDA